MRVSNTIQPVEINNQDSSGINETRRLLVESHWNNNALVHLKFGELNLLVSAEALRRAVINATNH